MRRHYVGLVLVVLAALALSSGPLLADQRPAGAPLTQGEFDKLVKVARDGETEVGPEPVHHPGKGGRKELKRAGAIVACEGEEWTRLSPEERRDRILELRRNGLSEDAQLILIIPTGDLLAVPASKRQELTDRGVIRPWVNSDYVELPTYRASFEGKRGDRDEASESDEAD